MLHGSSCTLLHLYILDMNCAFQKVVVINFTLFIHNLLRKKTPYFDNFVYTQMYTDFSID